MSFARVIGCFIIQTFSFCLYHILKIYSPSQRLAPSNLLAYFSALIIEIKRYINGFPTYWIRLLIHSAGKDVKELFQ